MREGLKVLSELPEQQKANAPGTARSGTSFGSAGLHLVCVVAEAKTRRTIPVPYSRGVALD